MMPPVGALEQGIRHFFYVRDLDFTDPFFRTKNWLVRKIVLSLQCSIDKDMEKVKLTEKEADLILVIRNYKKSYPNGYPEIRWYIEKLFNELLDEAENKE